MNNNIIIDKWISFDNYLEDMLVAVKNDELSISICKSYLVQYYVDAKHIDDEDFLDMIQKRSEAVREHGWAKSH